MQYVSESMQCMDARKVREGRHIGRAGSSAQAVKVRRTLSRIEKQSKTAAGMRHARKNK